MWLNCVPSWADFNVSHQTVCNLAAPSVISAERLQDRRERSAGPTIATKSRWLAAEHSQFMVYTLVMVWLFTDPEATGGAQTTQRFVWKDDTRNIYVMDNHRAASWCWARHISSLDSYDLAHIDAHWDVGAIPDKDLTTAGNTQFWEQSLEQLLAAESCHPQTALIDHANYIEPFIRAHPRIGRCVLHAREPTSTGNASELVPDVQLTQSYPEFCALVQSCGDRIIVNVDLDYAFDQDPSLESEWGDKPQVFTDAAITQGFSLLRSLVEQQRVAVVTVALSPSFCGGDEAAFRIWQLAASSLRVLCPLHIQNGEIAIS